MRKFQQTIRLPLAVAVLVSTISFSSCTKNDLLTNAGDVISSLNAALPLLTSLDPALQGRITTDIQTALKIADELKTAIANSSGSAASYLAQLIPVFQNIVGTDLAGVLDPTTRTAIEAALALADIALNFIASHLATATLAQRIAARASTADMAVIENFAKAPVWGKHYR